MRTLNREQVRRLDRRAIEDFGVPGVVLMENAGRGVAEKICALPAASPVAICCGKGNNGGDGFVIARHLELRGIEPRVLMWADAQQLRGDALVNYEIVRRSGIAVEQFESTEDVKRFGRRLEDATWIVDALLGTGFVGFPKAPLDAVIETMNAARAPKIAVDVPSGLDCDTGAAAGPAVRAAFTFTFVAAKPGLLAEASRGYVGELQTLDIGAPRLLVEQAFEETTGNRNS